MVEPVNSWPRADIKKIRADLIHKYGEITIPEPTEEDLAWKKKVMGWNFKKKFSDEMWRTSLKGNVWRINELVEYAKKKKIPEKELRKEEQHALLRASREGQKDLVLFCLLNYDLDKESSEWTFLEAVRHGKDEIIYIILDYGVDIHMKKDMAVRAAAINGSLEWVKFFCEQGADIHEKEPDYRCTRETCDALQHAAVCGHLDIVKYLVEQGADLARDNFSVYHYANKNDKKDVAMYLEKWVQEDELRKKKEAGKLGWFKIDKTTIMETKEVANPEVMSIQTIFNFKARQVQTIILKDKEFSATPPCNFRDFEGQAFIEEAKQELVTKGGILPPEVEKKQKHAFSPTTISKKNSL